MAKARKTKDTRRNIVLLLFFVSFNDLIKNNKEANQKTTNGPSGIINKPLIIKP